MGNLQSPGQVFHNENTLLYFSLLLVFFIISLPYDYFSLISSLISWLTVAIISPLWTFCEFCLRCAMNPFITSFKQFFFFLCLAWGASFLRDNLLASSCFGFKKLKRPLLHILPWYGRQGSFAMCSSNSCRSGHSFIRSTISSAPWAVSGHPLIPLYIIFLPLAKILERIVYSVFISIHLAHSNPKFHWHRSCQDHLQPSIRWTQSLCGVCTGEQLTIHSHLLDFHNTILLGLLPSSIHIVLLYVLSIALRAYSFLTLQLFLGYYIFPWLQLPTTY